MRATLVDELRPHKAKPSRYTSHQIAQCVLNPKLRRKFLQRSSLPLSLSLSHHLISPTTSLALVVRNARLFLGSGWGTGGSWRKCTHVTSPSSSFSNLTHGTHGITLTNSSTLTPSFASLSHTHSQVDTFHWII